MKSHAEIHLQRQYYARTASAYDQAHLHGEESHELAIPILAALMERYDFRSVLDVGSGTGRALRHLGQRFPDREIQGIEPVEEMRTVGHQWGIPPDKLRAGDATRLEFPDGSFDVVSAFGVLHHVPEPAAVIAEMLRVARRAIFISDANRFAQGGFWARRIKRWCYRLGAGPLLRLILTRGRGYSFSEGDGVFYSYSIFDNLARIRSECPRMHFVSLAGNGGSNLIYDAGQIALLALKPTPRTGGQ